MRQTGVERAILVGVWAGSENNGASEGRRGGWAMGRYGRSSARGGGEGKGGGGLQRQETERWVASSSGEGCRGVGDACSSSNVYLAAAVCT